MDDSIAGRGGTITSQAIGGRSVTGYTMTQENQVRLAGGVFDRRHIWAFLRGKDEEYRTFLPFFKDGIDDHQKAVNIVEESHRPEHLRRLGQEQIDTAKAEQAGQLEVHTWQHAYVKSGRFDQHAMLVLVEDLLTESRRQGYPLTRLTANMEWALQDLPGVENLVGYECTVNHVLAKHSDAVV